MEQNWYALDFQKRGGYERHVGPESDAYSADHLSTPPGDYFCSGVTYALAGSMDKVADQVFLLTPSNVEVSAEEKRRLQERGLYRS